MKITALACIALMPALGFAQNADSNPAASRTISGLAKTEPSSCRVEAIRSADHFPGATPQEQIHAAMTDLAGAPGIVTIPSTMAADTARWATPPNNILLQDFRFQNSYSLGEGKIPEFSHIYYDFHAGANSPWEVYTGPFSGVQGIEIDAFADAGGNGSPAYAGVVPLLAAVSRTGGSRPIWGANIAAGFSNNNNSVNSLEVDSSNTGTEDAALDKSFGVNLIASGQKRSGIGIQIGRSEKGSGWGRAISLADYSEVGLLFQTAESSRTADIYIVPPADDTAPAFVVRNHANSATRFVIDDSGDVSISGTLAAGVKHLKIDHPLDPANKYLSHTSVESSDMMNIYNGNAVLDDKGEAIVQLQDWFEALNRDFRYQLTSIGKFQQVYIAQEISGNRFKIAGGKPHGRVSWQVTGVRHDPYANAHRVPVEEEKKGPDRGTYLHPELFGHAESSASGAR